MGTPGNEISPANGAGHESLPPRKRYMMGRNGDESKMGHDMAELAPADVPSHP